VQRYIELNPVRAAMTDTPLGYRWSSVHASLGLEHDSSLAFHDAYLQLGSTPAARATAYGVCLREDVSADEAQAIRRHLQQERALGDPRFQSMVEKTLNRPVALRAPGRPRTKTANALAPPAIQTEINSGPI
jgi:putative transposase